MAEVTLKKDEPCDLDPNSENPCLVDNDNEVQNYFEERQGNRGLRAGRPQCRFTASRR